MITITYRASDGFRQRRRFKTLAGARKYAIAWIGPDPDIGSCYAVSHDGVGVIEAEGILVQALFHDAAPTPQAGAWEVWQRWNVYGSRDEIRASRGNLLMRFRTREEAEAYGTQVENDAQGALGGDEWIDVCCRKHNHDYTDISHVCSLCGAVKPKQTCSECPF